MRGVEEGREGEEGWCVDVYFPHPDRPSPPRKVRGENERKERKKARKEYIYWMRE